MKLLTSTAEKLTPGRVCNKMQDIQDNFKMGGHYTHFKDIQL